MNFLVLSLILPIKERRIQETIVSVSVWSVLNKLLFLSFSLLVEAEAELEGVENVARHHHSRL